MENFCCIDFDIKACQNKDRQDKNGQSMRAADSVCIQILGCKKGLLYIIEIYKGHLGTYRAQKKEDQIDSTVNILKENPLFEGYLRNNGIVKKIIVCEECGQGRRRQIYELISKEIQVFQESELNDKDDDQRIAKFVFDRK